MHAPRQPSPLPIDAVLGELAAALARGTSAVLVAPPGAGKTTRVPPALLAAPWLEGRRIVLLEPRRLAARAAAERMAAELGEEVGETVGIRARLDTRVGPTTRIEVVTEGVLSRLILDDPTLEGVGALLFDEFHERSLDADAGLAFALDIQAGLRNDLRIVVMSATIEGARVAGLLGGASVITAEGRVFPVETRYVGQPGARRLEEAMAETIVRAVRAEPGALLAFLPGQAEIRRTAERLVARLDDAHFDVVELHGGLDGRAQRLAIEPAAAGRRRIVLATSIAQTSLTIDGVSIVVDCGLERVPRFDAGAGITRLATVPVSRATADQRRGRAGRTAPGIAWRLWDEPQTAGLKPYPEPEIRAADLCGLLLDCAAWGTPDPARLAWLDPPPAGAVAAAREALRSLGAIDADGRPTALGRRIGQLPLPPRLARMVVAAADLGAASRAAEIAAVIVERGPGGRSPDIDDRLRQLGADRSERARGLLRLAAGWARAAVRSGPRADADAPDGRGRDGGGGASGSSRIVDGGSGNNGRSNNGRGEVGPGRHGSATATAATRSTTPAPSTAALLALAYPDRIARARGAAGHYLMAAGQGAMLDPAEPLARSPFLVVADLTGAAAAARILLAAPLGEDEVEAVAERAGSSFEVREETVFDCATAALRARRTTRLGAIVLASEPRPVSLQPENAAMLADGLCRLGVECLPWSPGQRQLRQRVAFLRRTTSADDGAAAQERRWPDLSDVALAATGRDWLAPFLGRATRLSDISAADLGNALDALLPWPMKSWLEAEAPTHFTAPTGSRHPIDYAAESAPLVEVRVQELFGSTRHPSIAGGRLRLTLALLSPAGRPVQITRDLPGFWAGSWREVKAEMKGRYPKHHWPDDPARAEPTTRAKRRGP